ncbi:MAG TPA: hypothetical protein VNZ49_07430 [Bacteroidia bacterium]|nr:hypothetical protein [Bacteroidia bacterium]
MKNIRRIFLLIAVFSAMPSFSQIDSVMGRKVRKFTFYGTWGYNRWAFTKSTIHFTNKGTPNDPNPTHQPYDFTLYDVSAQDSPDFDQIASKWSDVANFTIPQFSVRVGCYFNNKQDEGLEINYDHAKYVVTDGQQMHVKGTINGHSFDTLCVYPRNYFHFEHTDGANFWQLNYIKRWKIFKSKDGKSNIGWMFKPGAGVVIPRTDVTLFGNRLNNRWHLAGFIAGVETGLRAEFLNHFCLEFTAKAAYADYLWCYVQYRGNGNASHRFGTVGAILSLGYQFHHFAPGKKS